MAIATAQDVARRVGCSTTAISLVVNGRDAGRVSPELRARILDAVDALNYAPNAQAQGLASSHPNQVSLLCPDIRNPFFSELFHGLTDALAPDFSVNIVVGTENFDYGPAAVRQVQANKISGLILASPSARVLESLRPAGPTVLIDSLAVLPGVPTVNPDVRGAATDLAEHLLRLGHRQVVYLDVDRAKETFHLRRTVINAALTTGGGTMTVDRVRVADIATATDYAEAHARGWVATGVTAIVCADDLIAYGVLLGAAAAGVNVPAQLSVSGFNDLQFSALTNPALTTVDFNARALGTAAGRTLRERVETGQADNVIWRSRLVVRASTGVALTHAALATPGTLHV
ncbi:LacI family DNA-binding transcriptional regulator [Leifsonia kafniensis]|uniref:LacI family DNA-binding transcriptional regulator n=1 Tax=Leifsonia kafniensis TaxID=475957 RepID=A0ABP7KLS2_9MICO